jgi:molecular chaperone GrpE
MTHTPDNENADTLGPNDQDLPADAGPALLERLLAMEAENASLKDDLLRAVAEADNIRKRGEKAANDARIYAIDKFARDITAVADTLNRALATAPANPDESTRPLLDGIAMTEKTLLDVFERYGVKRIGAKGDKFDPNLHQAVAQIPSDAPAGSVAEVLQHGFVLADRTLRAAMVAVSLGQASAPPPADAGDGPIGGSVNIKV